MCIRRARAPARAKTRPTLDPVSHIIGWWRLGLATPGPGFAHHRLVEAGPGHPFLEYIVKLLWNLDEGAGRAASEDHVSFSLEDTKML
ncbi:hypothetical protein NDU88_000995 [Pleurodeles waltl]|uniref:Uncharacterized protein n=1 Tax=Pleurodeles waltl TaxID=8319 RepID=A0AAV7TH13_PLEWA|nr:hypothetical protein NDU88_000995 [Pleurodeles waltl]